MIVCTPAVALRYLVNESRIGDYMKLLVLSKLQRIGWYSASVVFGLGVILTGIDFDLFIAPQASWETNCVPLFCWLAVVFLLRIYIQDKDPNNWASLLGLKEK
jgi:hypothetical protein